MTGRYKPVLILRNCETDLANYFWVFSSFSVLSNYTVSMTILCNQLSSYLHMFPYIYIYIYIYIHIHVNFKSYPAPVTWFFTCSFILQSYANFYSPKSYITFTCSFQSNCRLFTFSFRKQSSLSCALSPPATSILSRKFSPLHDHRILHTYSLLSLLLLKLE